jgi:hypothetical protein
MIGTHLELYGSKVQNEKYKVRNQKFTREL